MLANCVCFEGKVYFEIRRDNRLDAFELAFRIFKSMVEFRERPLFFVFLFCRWLGCCCYGSASGRFALLFERRLVAAAGIVATASLPLLASLFCSSVTVGRRSLSPQRRYFVAAAAAASV
eukprot:TRINITY_DN9550_c0_g1_i2.p1 TRINITY_DN9550_c0_g1~~TRINITY_DN9550_c0_g1_i2.p1  ORF type:complete len:120 (+),score=17.59 TRINITY_DN9550_c0_g1_i2:224-583(+)